MDRGDWAGYTQRVAGEEAETPEPGKKGTTKLTFFAAGVIATMLELLFRVFVGAFGLILVAEGFGEVFPEYAFSLPFSIAASVALGVVLTVHGLFRTSN